MDISTIVKTIETILKGASFVCGRRNEQLQAIGIPSGGIKIKNFTAHDIVVHNFIATKGTFWAEIETDYLGRTRWGDNGRTRLGYNDIIPKGEERFFHHCIFFQDEIWWPYIKIRRLRLLHPYHVDILLSPGGRISEADADMTPVT